MRLTQRAAAWSLALACALAPSLAAAQEKKIAAPAGTIPLSGVAYGELGGMAQAVSSAFPLPVWCVTGCGGGGGGGGAGTEFAEDAPHTSGAFGTLMLGVRKDTAGSLAGADGDYTAPIFDGSNRLWVNPGTVAVTGTFWPTTQPVSGTVAVTGTFWQATQPVSSAALTNIDADLGAAGDTTCGTDVGSCSINAKLSRLAERMTSAIGELTAIKTATADVPTKPAATASVDASGAVTAGGTFQTVFAASAARLGCLIQNPVAATETLFVYEGTGTATTAKSINLAPGAAFNCNAGGIVVTGAVQVTAATTAHSFVAKSQ